MEKNELIGKLNRLEVSMHKRRKGQKNYQMEIQGKATKKRKD